MNAFHGSAVAAEAANVGNIGKQLFVVYNPNTMHILKKTDRYSELISADKKSLKRQLTMRQNKGQAVGYVVDTIENFHAADVQVEVKNLMSGLPCLINKSQVGSRSDPSTEGYWTM